MLVFTGGIGENDIASRAEICAGLGALGIMVDPQRNNVRGAAVISAENSPVTVRVLPPLEDLIIVNHVVRLLGRNVDASYTLRSESRSGTAIVLHWWVQCGAILMSATAVPSHTHRLPSPALRRFAWGVLAYFIAVILWGGLVRATGSGAGCGNHWPLCNGTVMQHSPRVDTMIEFTHRITSGISFFSVVALLVWTFAATVRGHLARAAAVTAVAFTLIEAALGAFLVKLGLTAQSHSPLRAPYLALHLTNTLLLLAALTLTAHFLARRAGFLRGKVRIAAPFVGIASLVVVLIVGVTGSLAALGDTLVPAELAGRSARAGFLCDRRLAGALALDASHRRVFGQRFSHLALGARRAAPFALG